MAIVIMGVSGSGKSTIGDMLAKAMGCRFLDADDFHPASNKEKMARGIPLSEEDRIPWLERLRDELTEYLMNRQNVILGCSALQKRYREILRSADPDYQPGSGNHGCVVRFVLLDAEPQVLAARLKARMAEGKHFMPASLLKSQLELLQIENSECIFRVDATLSPQVIVDKIQAYFTSNSRHGY